MAKKSGKVEFEQRVSEVYELLLNGYERPYIVRYGGEKWGVSDRQIEKYMRLAQGVLLEEIKSDRSNLLAKEVGQRNFLYRKAVRDGSWASAQQIADSRAKLLGLFDKPKDMPLLTAINTLMREGVLPHNVASTLINGIQELEERLRNASDTKESSQ